ncbi:hypothetical protein HYV86_03435 [Candidatus Woesearchaeota archaeon]|nr:hypothetical protein [Candidatus Woesearchaeota archaeon]
MGAKRGQITIFIIIGILMVSAFIFIIMLSSNTQKEQLKQAEEKIFTGAFKFPQLRMGVEDCLRDDLDTGLRLLGKQGTLWQGDPGGFSVYEEGKTGLLHPSGDRVAYGIARQEYPQPPDRESYQEAYPCPNDEDSPYFCQYTFPHPDAQFGARPFLTTGKIETALAKYIEEKTQDCVKEIIESKIQLGYQLEPGKLKTNVNLGYDAIDVTSEYEMTFRSGEDTVFLPTTFDFTYPTPFFRFASAILTLVREEQRFMEFDMGDEDMRTSEVFEYQWKPAVPDQVVPDSCVDNRDGTYTCTWKNPKEWIEQTITQVEVVKDPTTGDDIFEFHTSVLSPLNQQPYLFRLAVQNRAPALDYVSRNACPAIYDYLVIPGDNQKGDLDITLNAQDPDNPSQVIHYRFTNPQDELEWDGACINGVCGDRPVVVEFPADDEDLSAEKYVLRAERIAALFGDQPGLYGLIGHASDGKVEDNQTIRVLIDRPMTMDVKMDMPEYRFTQNDDPTGPPLRSYAQTIDAQGDDKVYLASIEDPVFVTIEYPENPSLNNRQLQHLRLSYVNDEETEKFEYTKDLQPTNVNGHFQFALPWFRQDLNGIDWYKDGGNADLISRWKDETGSPSPNLLGPDARGENSFSAFQQKGLGTLTLELDVAYCPTDATTTTSTESIAVRVDGCVPHVNPEHPWPYPKHYLKYQLNADGTTNFDIPPTEDHTFNPFLATHACCNPVTREPYNREDRKECFAGESQMGCFGTADELGSIARLDATAGSGLRAGYILETSKEVGTCDGLRGNTCTNINFVAESIEDEDLKCFDVSRETDPDVISSCDKVAPACAGRSPWTYQLAGDGAGASPGFWCHGPVGCGDENRQVCSTAIVEDVAGRGRFNVEDFKDLGEEDYHCGCDPETDVNENAKKCINLNQGLPGECRIIRRGSVSCVPN